MGDSLTSRNYERPGADVIDCLEESQPKNAKNERKTKESTVTVSGGNLLRFWENLEIFPGKWAIL